MICYERIGTRIAQIELIYADFILFNAALISCICVSRVPIKPYLINLNMRLKRGPFSQLNQINEALPTTFVSGTKPQ